MTFWKTIKTAVLHVSEEVLGFNTKINRHWFDESDKEIQELLEKKRSAYQGHLAKRSSPEKKAAFRITCSKLQHKRHEIGNGWWITLAKRTQLCADTGDYMEFYEALKVVYGPTYQVQSPMRSADGYTLLTDAGQSTSRVFSAQIALPKTQQFSVSLNNQ